MKLQYLTTFFLKDAECSLVDNLIAEKLILPTFRSDAPVLLRARVKLSRGTATARRREGLGDYNNFV